MVAVNRVVGFIVLALVIYYIVTDPTSAAGAVHAVGGTLQEAAESVTVFFRAVV